MAKKRKSDATRLDEVDRTMYTSFCSAANSLSQLYTQAMNHQRLSFQAGERNALVRLLFWKLLIAAPLFCKSLLLLLLSISRWWWWCSSHLFSIALVFNRWCWSVAWLLEFAGKKGILIQHLRVFILFLCAARLPVIGLKFWACFALCKIFSRFLESLKFCIAPNTQLVLVPWVFHLF